MQLLLFYVLVFLHISNVDKQGIYCVMLFDFPEFTSPIVSGTPMEIHRSTDIETAGKPFTVVKYDHINVQ